MTFWEHTRSCTTKKYWETGKHQQKESHHTKSVFSEPSTLSLEQLSKQVMNEASLRWPRWHPFKTTEEGIRKLLLNKAAGPDNLQPRVLKELADALAPIQWWPSSTMPKKKCLETGWPILKKGEKYKASFNSVLSAIYRATEIDVLCYKLHLYFGFYLYVK